ncbi:MAG: response regulator [Dehalococcoidia bacterium]
MVRYRSIRVLFVEDNPDDIEIARRAFKRTGAASDIAIARDGQEVLDRLFGEETSTFRPDLMLLDLNLPRVNGFEVLERVRASELYASMPVVVLTASGRQEDVQQTYRLGANSYIQKPAVFEQFAHLLEVLGEYWLEVATLPT